jgi:hypothetical protein
LTTINDSYPVPRLKSVHYYDSSLQAGYRDFLREPLRLNAAFEDPEMPGELRGVLVRDVPIGARIRQSASIERPK